MKPVCTFCAEVLKEHNTFCVVTCGHTFHQICVSDWLKLKNECPVCRKRADVGDIRKIFFTMEDTETTKIEGEEIAKDLGAIITAQTQEISKLKEQLKAKIGKSQNLATRKKKAAPNQYDKAKWDKAALEDKKRYEKEMAAYNNNK